MGCLQDKVAGQGKGMGDGLPPIPASEHHHDSGNDHINFGLAAEVAQKIQARPNQCWYNGFRAMQHLPENAIYVEGWMLRFGVPIEHGWCELDGQVIDPTFCDEESRQYPATYFAGNRYSRAGLLEQIQHLTQHGQSVVLPFIRMGHADQASYQAASLAALHSPKVIPLLRRQSIPL